MKMAVELVPLKPDQHKITFVPKTTTDLPFFNLTYRKKDIPKDIKYEGIDEAGHPIKWQVFHNTSDEIGHAGVEAHEVWYLLIKPAIDASRNADGTIPQIIQLGGMRECLAMVGWSAGGHQARELIKCLTQIAFAGCVADLWFPTGETDEAGKEKYLQIKSRFSRLSVYAIGEHHLTEDELKSIQFNFDLEDKLYIRLDPIEVQLQQLQAKQQRLIDNEYMFSVKPIARRWYELLAGKVYGTLKYNAPYFEIRYSWYIKHHHTLKRFTAMKRVTEQMNHTVQEHLDSGFLEKVEYRKVKEPDQEQDFLIRYFLGPAAKQSINRIQGHILNRRKRELGAYTSVKEAEGSQKAQIEDLGTFQTLKATEASDEQKATSQAPNFASDNESEGREAVFFAITTLETHLLPPQKELFRLLTKDFAIAESKAYEIVQKYPHERIDSQIRALPWREDTQKLTNKSGFLIKAIEESYSLPDTYVEHTAKVEAEKIREREAQEAAIRWAEQEALISACALCNDAGNRTVTHSENAEYYAIRQCTHDPAVEEKIPDWKKPQSSDDRQ